MNRKIQDGLRTGGSNDQQGKLGGLMCHGGLIAGQVPNPASKIPAKLCPPTETSYGITFVTLEPAVP